MQRLKIVQQIIIVLLLSVLIPFVTIGIIIANISQQNIRRELNYSAVEISRSIGEYIENYFDFSQEKLDEIAYAINFIPSLSLKKEYLNKVEKNSTTFNEIKIIQTKDIPEKQFLFNKDDLSISISSKIDENYAILAKQEIKNAQSQLSKRYKREKRGIYVFDSNNTLICTNTAGNPDIEELISSLPEEKSIATPTLFNEYKNTPSAYYTIKDPSWSIIVDTTEDITKDTINKARFRIILSLSLAALFIIGIVGIYTFYLYINIRQLFKGIIAISKGSYERKIHLLKSAFTPYEIVFLAKEFNYMAKKVAVSYKELIQNNIELEKLGEFKTNLVNAISHEFRTPLTSIVGYSSRLLRHDIVVDDETKNKSLKVIKQQAQRLSRMVEEILTIPDIESYNVHLNTIELDLGTKIEDSIYYVNTNGAHFDIQIAKDLKLIYSDSDKLEQILVNLCENAAWVRMRIQ